MPDAAPSPEEPCPPPHREPAIDPSQLFVELERRLREIARGFGVERNGHTLQPTALVHEAWLRMSNLGFRDRDHFLAAATTTMRTILIDHKRRKDADKRGGRCVREPFDAVIEAFEVQSKTDLLALDEALGALEQLDATAARYVSMRFFGGCTNAEAARLLGLSERSGSRLWTFVRTWLHARLAP